jgi:RNA polymerase sigma factor (sigma-70 family)
MLPSEDHSVVPQAQLFATTQWSAVVSAGADTSPESSRALEQLCVTYWYPLYAYVRRHGHSVEDAQDLTQEFFARLLERKQLRLADRNRGRFRTFLLTSLKHFLINEWKLTQRKKRGSGQKLVSLDEERAESRFLAEPRVAQPPDALYDGGWASVLMDRALMALRAELEHAGKLDLFEKLKAFAWGGKSSLSYAVMAAQLALTEGAVKVAIHRLRQRYGELLRAEVAQTVSTPAEVDEELRYLVSVIRNGLENSSNVAADKL